MPLNLKSLILIGVESVAEKRPRIVALDIMRGFFIAVIVIDHLAWNFNFFEPITGANMLWVSAAEGFFVISGILVGYIYYSKIGKYPKAVFKKLWSRALLLYLLAVSTTLLFTALAYSLKSYGTGIVPDGLRIDSIQNITIAALSFNYLYGLSDFPARYALLMVFAPIILLLLHRLRRTGVILTIGGAILAWLFLRENVTNSSHANIIIWEIFFIPSIVIGFYLPSVERWSISISKKVQTRILISLLTISAAIYILTYIHASIINSGLLTALLPISQNLFQPIVDIGNSLAPYTDKQSIGVVRIISTIVWFSTAYIIVRRFEAPINRFTRGFFDFLGRNSLVAYISHAFVLFFFILFVSVDLFPGVMLRTVGSIIVTLATLGLTVLYVKLSKKKPTTTTLGKKS